MKSKKEIISELRQNIDGQSAYEDMKEFIEQALKDYTEYILQEVIGEDKDTTCVSEECKFASWPICRHKQGQNDARQDIRAALNKLME